LLEKRDGRPTWQAGPVTLGQRLNSSRFPGGYEAISYGRGTWLFHMLRQMLRDTEEMDATAHVKGAGNSHEGELFMRILRQVQEKYAGREISTRELLQEFEERWPKPLWFEGKRSLHWFWDGWIQGTSIPKLEIKTARIVRDHEGTWAVGVVLQREAPEDFVTSVPIYAAAPGKEPALLGRVFADGTESSFRLRAPAGAKEILLDPEQTVLRRR
jgi:hypothetical protein